MSDEVIMIGKDGPSFEFPQEVSCDDEKPTVQDIERSGDRK